jgi:hypothetical protein
VDEPVVEGNLRFALPVVRELFILHLGHFAVRLTISMRSRGPEMRFW